MSGNDGREVTPVPIPNTEVKLSSADGSWDLVPVRVGRRQAILFRSSSAVELSAVNRSVVGSIPTCGAIGELSELAEGARLEIVYTSQAYQGFESLALRHRNYNIGPLVKWLRHRPFTAVTRVRIPYGSPLWRISSAGRAPALQAGGRRFDPVILHHINYINSIVAGWSSTVARRAHNPKVAGSNPVPATKWSRGVVVNMPACHAGDRRFDPGRDRHFNKAR